MVPSLMSIGGISFMLSLSGVLSPGPLLTFTIVESLRRGSRTGPLLVLGHGLLESVLILLIVSGLGDFLKKPTVMGIVATIGGIILFWMGYKMINPSERTSLWLKGELSENPKIVHPILSGILLSLSNPYWSIWWATVGLGYMMMAMQYGVMGLLAFFIGHITADFLWFSLVSYGVSSGRRVISNKLYQRIIGFCGLFLILFGIWFLTVGVRYFYHT